jgi:hypothetical protein
MVRSLENLPELATFKIALRVHAWSARCIRRTPVVALDIGYPFLRVRLELQREVQEHNWQVVRKTSHTQSVTNFDERI